MFGPASELREPSRRTLCRDSCSLNGLRWVRLPRPSYGRYIGTDGICWYGAKPAKPELLGFISESHSCFSVFKTAAVGDVADELFLWCLRSCSCVCDWAAARRPCSVDKPLTYNRKKCIVSRMQRLRGCVRLCARAFHGHFRAPVPVPVLNPHGLGTGTRSAFCSARFIQCVHHIRVRMHLKPN